ncbi:MAG: PAS domain S-box protein [Nitrospirae bacterium]|nr:PAS domain S-box protein [Nitrospirota bacterium]
MKRFNRHTEVEKQLEEMNRKFVEVEECRFEFEKAQKRYEQLLQSAPDAMVFVDRGAKIVLVNAQLCGLFGYSEQELLGRDIDFLIPERYRHRHHDYVAGYFEQPRVRHMGTNIAAFGLKKDGSEFPADISLSPIEAEGRIIAVAAIRDVTERKKAEDEKHRLMEQLAEAEKLSALGRIAANVADEIRNPLTAVGGFARRLRKIADSDKERQYAEYISSEVDRLERILRDVLAFSRKRSPLLEDHDIREILDEALKASKERGRMQSIVINKEYGDSAVVRVDKSLVGEAVEKLVANALDAMPGGGTLTLTTDREVVRGVPYVRVRIKDEGEGIPPEKLEKIFEPFFTTRTSPKGTGLGLSIAKGIIEEEGGTLRIESAGGKGTTATILFQDIRGS